MPELNPVSVNFAELVHQSQTSWRSRTNHWALSQSVELPSTFSKWFYEGVLDNLPDYIPADTQADLRLTHPIPIITAGVLIDSRLKSKSDPDNQRIITSKPNLADEMILPYILGMRVLNEIAADTLAADIIDTKRTKAGQRGNRIKSLAYRFLQFSAYTGGNSLGSYVVAQIAHSAGTKPIELFRTLAYSSLTADVSGVNEIVHQSGSKSDLEIDTIDDVAILLGGKLGVSYDLPAGLNSSKEIEKEIKHRQTIRGWIEESLKTNAVTSSRYPGVLSLVLLNKIPEIVPWASTGYGIANLSNNPFPGALFLLPFILLDYLSLRGVTRSYFSMTHEIAHYLGTDTTRLGIPRR